MGDFDSMEAAIFRRYQCLPFASASDTIFVRRQSATLWLFRFIQRRSDCHFDPFLGQRNSDATHSQHYLGADNGHRQCSPASMCACCATYASLKRNTSPARNW